MINIFTLQAAQSCSTLNPKQRVISSCMKFACFPFIYFSFISSIKDPLKWNKWRGLQTCTIRMLNCKPVQCVSCTVRTQSFFWTFYPKPSGIAFNTYSTCCWILLEAKDFFFFLEGGCSFRYAFSLLLPT